MLCFASIRFRIVLTALMMATPSGGSNRIRDYPDSYAQLTLGVHSQTALIWRFVYKDVERGILQLLQRPV
jgi:hypothetical protein